MKKVILNVVYSFFSIIVIGAISSPAAPLHGITNIFYILFLLLFGWLAVIYKHLQNIQWNGGMIALAILLCFILPILFHKLATKYHSKWKLAEWNVRWSRSITLLFLSVFISGFSLLGIIHQFYGMTMKDQKFIHHYSGRESYERSASINNLKQIGLGVHNFHDAHLTLPAYGVNPEINKKPDFNEVHPPMSWEMKILPFLDQNDLYIKIDPSLPWDHQKNQEVFQTEIPKFLNPKIERKQGSGEGYKLSHYSANALIFARSQKMRLEEIKDGESNTLMFGEISENFSFWGKPGNWRDPRIGLNSQKKGFRGPYGKGTFFMLADGTVRFINNDIDPEVLKALSTPAGMEEIHGEY